MTKETFNIKGENLLKKVKELIAEGNVRNIIISDKSGKDLAHFPLTMATIYHLGGKKMVFLIDNQDIIRIFKIPKGGLL
jgi:hypothetical protein